MMPGRTQSPRAVGELAEAQRGAELASERGAWQACASAASNHGELRGSMPRFAVGVGEMRHQR